MAKRKAISTSTRFEIFKRDSFQCQYCGRTPPAVILNVDHVHPVADGGDNSPENLLTACEECNSGKSDKLLSQVTPTLQDQMEQQERRQQQLDEYNHWLMQRRARTQDDVVELGHYWFNFIEKERDAFIFGSSRAPTIKRFLSMLPKASILDAIDIAMARMPVYGGNDYKAWKYFCGICWNRIRENDPNA